MRERALVLVRMIASTAPECGSSLAASVFRERGANQTRVSVRTTGPWDASKISAHYNGGGHIRAAGCTVDADIDHAEQQVVAYVSRVLTTGEY